MVGVIEELRECVIEGMIDEMTDGEIGVSE